MTHEECVLDPGHAMTERSISLRIGWRPEFAGYGFWEIHKAAREMAAVELKEHRDYDGPFDLLPLPATDAAFPFLVAMRPPEDEEED